jgi:phage anti-repressor protein
MNTQLATLLPILRTPIGNEEVNAIDARKLHNWLDNKAHFATWIKERIDQYGFLEHTDFETFSLNGEKGRPAQEYMISVPMAKELSMVERNARGKEAL